RTAGNAFGRVHETAPSPIAELRDRAAREPRRLRGGVAHAGLGIVATPEALAPGATLLAEDAAQPAAGAQPSRERLQSGPTQLAHVALDDEQATEHDQEADPAPDQGVIERDDQQHQPDEHPEGR